jgi:diguanylate cyclase (GGDEF)-like protein
MDISGGKILIIDDDQAIRNMLTAILENDYEITSTDNSFDGLRRVREEAPDLVLLDINMPLFDGYELCRLLKADPATKEIPLIFITSLSSTDYETKGLEIGAADYIVKPINPSIVLARVKNQIQVKLQRDHLKRIASIDPLTEVANRRSFDECLEREWRRCQRDNKPLSLVMFDIDRFKLYNDHYGHVAGDKCLVTVAQLLQSVPHRGGDLLARIGGEEFAAILPDTAFVFLDFMAEKFRSAVEEAALPHAKSDTAPVVTISIGGITTFPHQKQSAVELMKKADELLYKAKEEGRNRACMEDMTAKK